MRGAELFQPAGQSSPGPNGRLLPQVTGGRGRTARTWEAGGAPLLGSAEAASDRQALPWPFPAPLATKPLGPPPPPLWSPLPSPLLASTHLHLSGPGRTGEHPIDKRGRFPPPLMPLVLPACRVWGGGGGGRRLKAACWTSHPLAWDYAKKRHSVHASSWLPPPRVWWLRPSRAASSKAEAWFSRHSAFCLDLSSLCPSQVCKAVAFLLEGCLPEVWGIAAPDCRNACAGIKSAA